MAELFKPLPSFVVAHYLGVPEADWARFDGWTEAIVAANALGDPLLAADDGRRAVRLLQRPHRAAAGRPGRRHDLAAGARPAPTTCRCMQVLGFAFTMVTGGNDTTTGLLGVTAELLTRHPDQRARLLADPALLDGAVEELPAPDRRRCRAWPARRRRGRVSRHHHPGRQEGAAAVRLGQPRPARVRADGRGLRRRRADRATILTFSYGAHHCLGAAAARLQARVVARGAAGPLPPLRRRRTRPAPSPPATSSAATSRSPSGAEAGP